MFDHDSSSDEEVDSVAEILETADESRPAEKVDVIELKDEDESSIRARAEEDLIQLETEVRAGQTQEGDLLLMEEIHPSQEAETTSSPPSP